MQVLWEYHSQANVGEVVQLLRNYLHAYALPVPMLRQVYKIVRCI